MENTTVVGKKKKKESSKKQNLNLPYTGNYLHTIYIVIGTMCVM